MNWLTESDALLLMAFGVIVGTSLTLAMTWWRERAKTAAERQIRLRWLLTEIVGNLEHVERYTGRAVGRTNVKLPTQAWEAVKGDILELDGDMFKLLCVAYAEIWRLNAILEDHSDRSSLVPQSHMVKAALSDSQSKLEGYLGFEPRPSG